MAGTRSTVARGRGGRDRTASPAGQAGARWRRELALNPPRLRFDGRIHARAGLIGCAPQSGGVYLFADFRGVLYVGQTANLRRRLVEHLEGSHNSWLTGAISRPVGVMEFGWILAGPDRRAGLERCLIRAFRPLCNHAMNGD